jgi:hypothetical protein
VKLGLRQPKAERRRKSAPYRHVTPERATAKGIDEVLRQRAEQRECDRAMLRELAFVLENLDGAKWFREVRQLRNIAGRIL